MNADKKIYRAEDSYIIYQCADCGYKMTGHQVAAPSYCPVCRSSSWRVVTESSRAERDENTRA